MLAHAFDCSLGKMLGPILGFHTLETCTVCQSERMITQKYSVPKTLMVTPSDSNEINLESFLTPKRIQSFRKGIVYWHFSPSEPIDTQHKHVSNLGFLFSQAFGCDNRILCNWHDGLPHIKPTLPNLLNELDGLQAGDVVYLWTNDERIAGFLPMMANVMGKGTVLWIVTSHLISLDEPSDIQMYAVHSIPSDQFVLLLRKWRHRIPMDKLLETFPNSFCTNQLKCLPKIVGF